MPFHHLFRNPPIVYRLVPFWFWNGDMDAEKIVHQIREMAEKGVGAQAIPLEEPTGAPLWSGALDLTQSMGSVPAEFVFQSTRLTAYTHKRSIR